MVNVERQDDGVLRVKDDAIRRLSEAHDNVGQEADDAQKATAFEKSLTIPQAVSLYKRAICYSLIMSLAVVMEG